MNKYKSDVLKDFDPAEYQFFGLWKQDLFSACFWVSSWSPEIFKKLGLEAKELGSCVLGPGNFFVKKSVLGLIDGQITNKILAGDELFFDNMLSVAKEVYSSTTTYAQSFGTQEPTPANFKKFVEGARSINLLWMLGAEQFVVTAERLLQDAVVQVSFPADKVPDIIPKLITPLYYQHKEAIELKKEIAGRSLSEIKKDQKLFRKIEEHAKHYSWIETANFIGEPLSIERLYEQIVHLKEDPLSDAITSEPLSEQMTIRASIMSKCGYIKQAGAEHFGIYSDKALPFLKLVADKIGLTYSEFLLSLDTEIMQALEGKISTLELKARANSRKGCNYVVFAGSDEKVLFTEDKDDVKLLMKEMIPVAESGSKEIKGQVGNKGKYTGPVRVIMNTPDFPKMQTGDVLVSTMTTPDFVVLMHKAGAIVTDIGGLLCHAAIVSREINKPCVIGTKFATHILKDGDMVEVDADNGVVRIVKSNE